MHLLVLDTALDRVQAGVFARATTGVVTALAAFREEGHGRSEAIVDLAERAIADAGLPRRAIDRVAATTGPGSFTGLRVALAASRAHALVLGVPAVGIGTLAAFLAEGADGSAPVLAVVDARHGACYAALADAHGAPRMEPAHVEIAAIATRLEIGTRVVGKGAGAIARAVVEAGGPALDALERAAPDLAVVAALAADGDPGTAPPRPLYLKPAAAAVAAPVLARVP